MNSGSGVALNGRHQVVGKQIFQLLRINARSKKHYQFCRTVLTVKFGLADGMITHVERRSFAASLEALDSIDAP